MVERVSIDDFDWSSSGSVDAGSTPPQPAADEPAPPPSVEQRPLPEPQRGGGDNPPSYGLDESLLPKAYVEAGRKNIYKRRPQGPRTRVSIDDFDWSGSGDAGRTGGPAYNPDDDWAITRGFKAGEQGGGHAVKSALEMARISALTPEEQVTAMLDWGNQPRDPGEAKLQVEGFSDIGGVGDFFTWLGEFSGQMAGSALAAAEYGGLPGGAVGAGIGGLTGATAGGVGAIPGAVVGGTAGFASGSLAAYGAMGVGGLFDDLMRDDGVKKGLADGTIDTNSLIMLSTTAGLAIGALDAWPAGKAVGRIAGKEGKELVKQTIKKAILKGALRGAKEEGTTEAIQGAISEIAQAVEGGDVNLVERLTSVLDQGLAGAVGGAGPGAVGGYAETEKPDPTLRQEYEFDYETGTAKPSTRSAPQTPPGAGAPPASAVPHNPVGGIGQVPSQPAGARARRGPAPATAPTVVQPGEVSPDLQAAATAAASGAPAPTEGQSVAAGPTAPQPAPRQRGTGDKSLDAALTTSVAPAPTAVTPQVAPQLQPPADTAYRPTPPEAIAPTNVDMLQGLPNYAEAVPPVAPPSPPPAPAMPEAAAPQTAVQALAPPPTPPAPALVTEPTVPPPVEPPLDLVSPRLSEDRRMELSEFAGQLYDQDVSDREEAAQYMDQLAGKPEERDYFYSQLSRPMKAFIDSRRQPEIAPERPLAAPPARRKPFPRVPAPAKVPKRPKPVSLKPVTVAPAPAVPKPTTKKVTVRVTPVLHERRAGAIGEEAAEARLVRATVRHPKTRRRLGQVADIMRREKEDTKTGAKSEERLFKLSFKKEPVTREELLSKYAVETTATEERLPERAVEAIAEKPDTLAAIAKRLAQHFKVAKARPVLLSSVGMEPDQITALEKAGLAEDGSMDASEFDRWDKSRRGAVAPPRTAPYVERELPKKKTFFQPKRRPTEQEQQEQRRKERSRERDLAAWTHAERQSEIPRVGWKNLWQKQTPKTAPLQQEVELELAARLRRESRAQGRLEPTIHLGDILKASEQAIAGVKATKLPPFALLRKRFEDTINDAIAAYKAGRLSEQKMAEKALAAQAKKAKWFETYRRYEKRLLSRTVEGKNRYAEALAAEDFKTWRVKAYAAEKAKRAGKPYDRLVFKMAEHFHTLSQFQKYKDAKSVARKEKARARIDAIQEQRVAAAKKADAIEFKAEQEAARAHAREMRAAETRDQRETAAYLKRMVDEGEIEQGLSELLAQRENRGYLKKFKQRAARAVKTTPVLTRVIKAEKAPVITDERVARFDPTKAKKRFTRAQRAAQKEFVAGIRASVVTYTEPARTRAEVPLPKLKHLPEGYLRQTRVRAVDFVNDAKAALRKANAELPTRVNRWFNTPEENGLIYIARLLAVTPPRVRAVAPTAEDYALFEKQRELGITGRPRTKIYKKVMGRTKGLGTVTMAGDLTSASKRGVTATGEAEPTSLARTANIHDAVVVMTLLKDMVNARTPEARRIAEDELNGAIFDKVRESQLTAQQQRAAEEIVEEAPETIEEELSSEAEARMTARIESERRAFLEAKMREARTVFETKGWLKSPIGLPEEGPLSPEALSSRPMGTPVESLSGAEALNRFTAKWRVLEGAPRGWRRWVRASLIRSLRQLVGDIDVHVVDGAYTGNKAGVFVAAVKPYILINRAALGRPGVLADTIIHEMTHAATHYALHNNLRGTRDIVEAMMAQLQRQLFPKTIGMSAAFQHAFKNVDEFLTAGMENAEFQDMLASLAPTTELRAQIRALGRGRAMPNFWDQFVAMVENAIGFFTPAGHGASYMSQLLKIYPHVAMPLAEQQRDTGVTPTDNDILEAPFDFASIRNVVNNTRAKAGIPGGVKRFIRRNLPTEELRRVIADKYFGGNLDNPTKPLIDMLLKHARMIEDRMAPGDRMDAAIRDWVNRDRRVREPFAAKAYETVADATADDVDPRKELKDNTWIRDDQLHPSKRRKKPTLTHIKHTAKRETHRRLREQWLALPTELQDLMSKRLDHMSTQWQEYEHNFSRNMLRMWMDKDNPSPVKLPRGITEDQAIQQIMNGTITPALEKALGKNADTAKGMGKLTRKGRLYAPLFRAGEHYISGRRKIATPAGATQETDDRGHFQFYFEDQQKMEDYLEAIGKSGDERFIGTPQKVRIKQGKKEVQRWRVTMQDRFMAMSDDPAELLAMKTDMMASGDYVSVSDPGTITQVATSSAGMPLNLQKMIDNLKSMSGYTDAEKNVMQQMIQNMFVQTQQGNRITKKQLRRKGVHGYQTGFDDMTTAFRTNNEMMSRHLVALDRMPVIKKAQSYLRKYKDALERGSGEAFDKLEPADQARISRDYGKNQMGAIDFESDVKAITDRIEAAMKPQGKPVAEAQWNAFIGTVTMNYLMSPMYYALQTAGVALQTYPRMIAEVAKTDSVATAVQRAAKLLYEAGTEVSFLGNYTKSVTEALAEGRHLVEGFKPRQDWAEVRPHAAPLVRLYGRPLRQDARQRRRQCRGQDQDARRGAADELHRPGRARPAQSAPRYSEARHRQQVPARHRAVGTRLPGAAGGHRDQQPRGADAGLLQSLHDAPGDDHGARLGAGHQQDGVGADRLLQGELAGLGQPQPRAYLDGHVQEVCRQPSDQFL